MDERPYQGVESISQYDLGQCKAESAAGFYNKFGDAPGREQSAYELLDELINDGYEYLYDLQALRDSLPLVMDWRAERALKSMIFGAGL